MKNVLLLLLTLLLSSGGFTQTAHPLDQDIIQLGRAYKDYMFRNTPAKKYLKSFTERFSDELAVEAAFIKQTIKGKNDLLDDTYLVLPSTEVLKNLYLIREVNLNLREEGGPTNKELLDSLREVTIPRYELVDNYYKTLFIGVGNKNKPFNLSKVNFTPAAYGLQDETEIGIFFLRCMELCGTNIWGYMNIVKPPNTSEALAYINRYPKFNGQPYYQFTDLYFKDFQMIISDEEGLQSYKSYYLNKYFETLLSHLVCLKQEDKGQEKIRDLLLGSILSAEDLYKYTEYREVLESIFQKKG